jgi:hypothetical protein
MKIHSLLIVMGLYLFTAADLYAGGGWPQAKGKAYLKIAEWWVTADQHYTSNGKIDPNITGSLYNTTIYAEYGITKRLTGIFYMPLFSRAVYNTERSAASGNVITQGAAINHIGDADIAIKYGLIVNKPTVVSATLLLGLPLGRTGGGGLGILQTGDGEFNQLLQIDVSRSFKLSENKFGYVSVYGGFNNRSKGFSDELRYGVEAGTGWFKDKLFTILRFQGVKSLYNGPGRIVSDGTSFFANNTQFLAIAPEVSYFFNKNIGVTASVGGALFGSLIYARPSYSVGFFVKL